MRMCEAKGCTAAADGVVGVAIYPTQALMAYYKTDTPLTRMILGLATCETHRAELDINELFPAEFMDNMVRCCELSTGVTVDRNGMKLVRVGFDDPDYLLLLKQALSTPPEEATL